MNFSFKRYFTNYCFKIIFYLKMNYTIINRYICIIVGNTYIRITLKIN